MPRLLPTLLALLLVTFCASAAQAKTRVTIHEFFGPHGSALRAEAERLLKRQDTLQVITKDEIDAAARSLGIDVLSPAGRRTMARELALSAWVTGFVRKRAGSLRLTVVVYDGAEHASVGRAVLTGKNPKILEGAVKRQLWHKSKDAILLALAPLPPGRAPIEADARGSARDQASDAAPSEPLPVTSTPPGAEEAPPARAEPPHSTHSASAPEAPSSSSALAPAPGRDSLPQDESRKRKRLDALHVFVGVGSPFRKLSYSDPISSSLGDTQLSGMAMLDMSLVYYPARSFSDGWASWLGLDFAGQFALGGGNSSDREGNRFQAHYGAYRVGGRVRAPIKRHFVSAFSGYAMNRTTYSSETKGVESPTPDVDYRMVRTGAGAELQLISALGLALDAAWLHMLSVGEIGTWFPHATAAGFELAMHIRYALGHRLFTRLSGTYQRTAYDFHAQPGDAKVAGGATDQFLTASLAIGVGI